MNSQPVSRLALAAVMSSFAACSLPTGPAVPVEGGIGVSVRLADIADECATHDVVFFGEQHHSDACHAQQLALLQLLHQRRPDLVVSMEMFERDVQETLEKYLAGELEEAEFKKQARAWPNWADYRPIVVYARDHRLPVLAANAPKALVRKVSQGGGLAAVRGERHVARVVEAPEDTEYYAAFAATMKTGGHGAMDDAKVRLYYQAQCVWDATMAETIADHLTAAHAAGRRPLVYHLCGTTHSDRRRGTVQQLLARKPGLSVRVIATTDRQAAWFRTETGDYQLMAANRPPRPASPHKAAKPPEVTEETKPTSKPAGTKPTETKPAGTSTASKPAKPATTPDPNARPALGFKPGYEAGAEPGLLVDAVTEGGPADKAGMKDGDLLVQLAGEAVADIHGYMDVLGDLEPGQKVTAVVKRAGKKVELKIQVGTR